MNPNLNVFRSGSWLLFLPGRLYVLFYREKPQLGPKDLGNQPDCTAIQSAPAVRFVISCFRARLPNAGSSVSFFGRRERDRLTFSSDQNV